MYVQTSTFLQKKLNIALSGVKSSIYEPTCTFVNGNTEYKKTWKTIEKLMIMQDFTGSFSDVIQGVLKLQPTELRELLQNMQDLQCFILLKPIRAYSFTYAANSEPLIITGRVLLDFKDDMDKMFTAQSFGQRNVRNENNPIQTPDQAAFHSVLNFHLVEGDVYTMRNTQMNCIIRDATPEKIIHWASERMGAEEVSAIPPDNTQNYSNFVIPPMKSVQDVFPYMQERCGVYSKGMGYYYTGKKMYVYPQSDQSQSTSPTQWVVHLINAPAGSLDDVHSYHNVVSDDKEIYIASSTQANAETKTTEATENNGNAHVSLQADRMQDNLFTKNSDGTVSRNESTVTSLSQQNTAGNMTQTTQRVVYDGESSNPYTTTSAMAAADATNLVTGWMHAVPRLLEPGQTIFYHFDGQNGEYKIQKGRLEKVAYESTLHAASLGKQAWMSFAATLHVRLDPEYLSESETQTTQS